jgi:hypothetical protein
MPIILLISMLKGVPPDKLIDFAIAGEGWRRCAGAGDAGEVSTDPLARDCQVKRPRKCVVELRPTGNGQIAPTSASSFRTSARASVRSSENDCEQITVAG